MSGFKCRFTMLTEEALRCLCFNTKLLGITAIGQAKELNQYFIINDQDGKLTKTPVSAKHFKNSITDRMKNKNKTCRDFIYNIVEEQCKMFASFYKVNDKMSKFNQEKQVNIDKNTLVVNNNLIPIMYKYFEMFINELKKEDKNDKDDKKRDILISIAEEQCKMFELINDLESSKARVIVKTAVKDSVVDKNDCSISFNEVVRIARQMRSKSKANDLKGTVKEVLATAQLIPCKVDGQNPSEIIKKIKIGRYIVPEV